MKTFKDLVETLKEKHLTISSVESFTGGLFASHIVDIPGSSSVFKGSIVSYSEEIKSSLVGVPASLIDEKGVVSSEVAKEMALRGKKILNTDICISFTGDAGPTTEKKNDKVGEAYIGIALNEQIIILHPHFQGTRNEIREAATRLALEYIFKLFCTF